MKDLAKLIKDSVKDKPTNSVNDKSLTQKMFDIADKVTDELGERSATKKIINKKIAVKNVTFSLSIDAEKKLNEQVGRYIAKTGEIGYKSHILIAAIHLISNLSDDDFIKAVSEQQYAEKGRPV